MSIRESTLLSPSSYSGFETSRSMDESENRIVISLDYGTTYTGAAWAITQDRPLTLADIHVVNNWPPRAIEPKVPSEYTYSKTKKGHYWGNEIDPSAKILKRTKLELPVQQRSQALRLLAEGMSELPRVLNNSNNDDASTLFPQHLTKTPGEIVADYLKEVAYHVQRDIDSENGAGSWKHYSIDLVVTHPAEWDDRARNLTFKASQQAFDTQFRHKPRKLRYTYLVTEPEACAQYAIKESQGDNVHGLRKGDCFVVVDAGGGTVDLVSYRVDAVSPRFSAVKVTNATGASCGATRIDDYFLETFLAKRLDAEDYHRLRESPGFGIASSYGPLTEEAKRMLSDFVAVKHSFAGHDETADGTAEALPSVLRLPDNVEDRKNGNRSGELRILPAEIKHMFKEPVEKTLQLLDGQLLLLHGQQLQARAIFLSGGFSRNAYLQKRVNEYAHSHRRMDVICGQDSWSAVSKGAVLIGCGDHGRLPMPVNSVQEHIGIQIAPPFAAYDHGEDQRYYDSFDDSERARYNIKWLVAKGDLMPDGKPIVKHEMVVRKVAHDSYRKRSLVIVRDRTDTLYERSNRLQKENDKQVAESLEFDLDDVIEGLRCTRSQLEELKNEGLYKVVKKTNEFPQHHRIVMLAEIQINLESVHVILSCGRVFGHDGSIERPGIELLNQSLPFDGEIFP